MGSLHDPVTWYKITNTGEQVAQRDFQNKGRSRWTGTSCIVLEIPLRNLLTCICNFAPCDRIVRRAHFIRRFKQVYHYLAGSFKTLNQLMWAIMDHFRTRVCPREVKLNWVLPLQAGYNYNYLHCPARKWCLSRHVQIFLWPGLIGWVFGYWPCSCFHVYGPRLHLVSETRKIGLVLFSTIWPHGSSITHNLFPQIN